MATRSRHIHITLVRLEVSSFWPVWFLEAIELMCLHREGNNKWYRVYSHPVPPLYSIPSQILIRGNYHMVTTRYWHYRIKQVTVFSVFPILHVSGRFSVSKIGSEIHNDHRFVNKFEIFNWVFYPLNAPPISDLYPQRSANIDMCINNLDSCSGMASWT